MQPKIIDGKYIDYEFFISKPARNRYVLGFQLFVGHCSRDDSIRKKDYLNTFSQEVGTAPVEMKDLSIERYD